MTKHLADHRSAPQTARKKHFWAMEKRGETDRPHPAISALRQRPQAHNESARMVHYLRIERGATT
ncbi:hypothetical protein [Pseudorhodobacter sp.]|uniref:hypothetical protein n=1 Tax=Pseudorhodobacter sp. TaxID=1934400 RepID=UPI002AFF0232|nr:hypothetical protein [Pseudorhodobacter sp.]